MTTAPLSPQRALDIIAAYGADSRRWPADERAAALMMSIADPAVAAALAEAKQLDAQLGAWARDVPPAAPLAATTLVPMTFKLAAPLRQRRWWAGAAVAAAVATLVVVQAPSGTTTPVEIATVSQNVSPAPSAAGESEVLADAEVFATVFTPTADEDQVI